MSAGPRDDLVLDHLGLARSLARRYANRGEPLEDLEQVARLGLVRAAERYDPDRGVPFVGFAVPTILGELKRHFRDRTWPVQVPRRVRDLVPTVSQAMERRSVAGQPVTATALAEDLGLEVEVVLEVMEASSGYRPAPLEGARDVVARHGDEDQVVDRQALRELLLVLSERDRRIVVLAWYADWTQDRIAAVVGLSQVQVSRVLRRSADVMARSGDADAPGG